VRDHYSHAGFEAIFGVKFWQIGRIFIRNNYTKNEITKIGVRRSGVDWAKIGDSLKGDRIYTVLKLLKTVVSNM